MQHRKTPRVYAGLDPWLGCCLCCRAAYFWIYMHPSRDLFSVYRAKVLTEPTRRAPGLGGLIVAVLRQIPARSAVRATPSPNTSKTQNTKHTRTTETRHHPTTYSVRPAFALQPPRSRHMQFPCTFRGLSYSNSFSSHRPRSVWTRFSMSFPKPLITMHLLMRFLAPLLECS